MSKHPEGLPGQMEKVTNGTSPEAVPQDCLERSQSRLLHRTVVHQLLVQDLEPTAADPVGDKVEGV